MSGDTEHEALIEVIAQAFPGWRDTIRGHPAEAAYDHRVNDAARDMASGLAATILAEFMPEHDKRVRAEQREADIAAVIAAAPPINAELSPITGAVEDAGMAAYIEGFHDAWAAIREASDD